MVLISFLFDDSGFDFPLPFDLLADIDLPLICGTVLSAVYYSFLSLKKYTLLETYPSLTANADKIISNMKEGFEYFAVSSASVSDISYETTKKLQKNRVKLLFMTFESAIIKLMLCAGNNKLECIEKNIIGEI